MEKILVHEQLVQILNEVHFKWVVGTKSLLYNFLMLKIYEKSLEGSEKCLNKNNHKLFSTHQSTL